MCACDFVSSVKKTIDFSNRALKIWQGHLNLTMEILISDKKLQHQPQSFEDARSCAKPKNIRVPKQYQFLLTIHLLR